MQTHVQKVVVNDDVIFQVLASVVRGCRDDVLGDKLNDIVELLVSSEVCQASEKVG